MIVIIVPSSKAVNHSSCGADKHDFKKSQRLSFRIQNVDTLICVCTANNETLSKKMKDCSDLEEGKVLTIFTQ